MTGLVVGVAREGAPGERRVALVPDAVAPLTAVGFEVLVEAGAGGSALAGDDAYAAAGAEVVDAAGLYARAGVLVSVGPPAAAALSPGRVLLGLLEPLRRPGDVRGWAAAGVTAVSLDLLPRTLSRAQAMDALTSQANVAGYKAAVLAADTYGGFFPMFTTAAGTNPPATVLVLGAGVAGLQAIGTAARLGAVVTGYDVRPEARGEVESVGARFLDLGPLAASGEGGYARELTADERRAQQDELDRRTGRFDVVITTAQVPGRRPPVLVTARALDAMRPGSVVVDLAAGELGGNVEGSLPGRTVVRGNGVTVVGAGRLPSAMAPAASAAYSRNAVALLTTLVRDGRIAIDLADEVQAGVVVTHDGAVVHPAVAALLEPTEV